MVSITVAIPTHNPSLARLERVLDALENQTLPRDRWSVLLIDNASSVPVAIGHYGFSLRIIREERLGLTWARLRALNEALTALIVFVDDDNILDRSYLAEACRIAEAHPLVGAFGGKSLPGWEEQASPPDWLTSFERNLALRDLGDKEIIQEWIERQDYPAAAPIGAGMVIRKAAAVNWIAALARGAVIADRTGGALTSGGDNDIVMHCVRSGYRVGYFPQLQLTHIIPKNRLTPGYHAKLNRGIARSWVQVLALHGICPWRPIPRWTVPLRSARAYLRYRAWVGPAERIRWHGARGHFEGLAAIRGITAVASSRYDRR